MGEDFSITALRFYYIEASLLLNAFKSPHTFPFSKGGI
jgi:hypothetical protein